MTLSNPKNRKLSLDISLLSTYRAELMGLSIIFIMLCHNNMQFSNDSINSINTIYFKRLFQVGVDIFLLLSGLGNFRSYKHSQSVFSFYKKRLIRIIPTYIVTIGAYILFEQVLFHNQTINNIIDDYSLITFFTRGSLTEWFVAAIIVLYLLTPVFYKILSQNKYLFFSLLIVIWIISYLPFFIRCNSAVYTVCGTFILRIPIYMIGMYLEKYILSGRNTKLNNTSVFIFAFLFIITLYLIVSYSNSQYTLWFVRCLFAPLALLFSLFFTSFCSKIPNSIFSKILISIGSITFEIYLLHEKILGFVSSFLLSRIPSIWVSLISQIIAIILSIIVAYIIHLLIAKIISNKKDNRRTVT